MGINDLMDKLVQSRQERCDHLYQDRVIAPRKTYCGRCGKEEE